MRIIGQGVLLATRDIPTRKASQSDNYCYLRKYFYKVVSLARGDLERSMGRYEHQRQATSSENSLKQPFGPQMDFAGLFWRSLPQHGAPEWGD